MVNFFRGRTDILRIYRVYDAKDIKKHENMNNNIRTSNKKAKKEMKNETDVNNGLVSCEISLGKIQHKQTQLNQKIH